MSFTALLYFILVVQAIHFIGTWKLYIKAGRQWWEAAIPVYNAVVLMKIIKRPWWWTILLFIPVINIIVFPIVWIETIRSFGKNTTKDTLIVIFSFGLYIYYLNYVKELSYVKERSLNPRTVAEEWIGSILFAVVAATIVHIYIMQPYTIPTSSLEKTLLVGDFLFVSKFHYGARIPMTPISFPMVHDTIPVLKKKSYTSGIQLPYLRIPGFQKIKRNEIVVFGWPADTVNAFRPYGDGLYHKKPIDKKSNYVKRCVGLPGDSLEVRGGYVFINGKQNQLPDRAKLQFIYYIQARDYNSGFNMNLLASRYGITDAYGDPNNKIYVVHATQEAIDKFKNHPNVANITQAITPKGLSSKRIFPHSSNYAFNEDHFGPIYIPEAGKTVAITIENLPLYKSIIETYEGTDHGIDRKITLSGNQVLLNGTPISSYTFEQDYYWMMGDNRNNSEDSRFWGFVPFDHVVGKPVFVWMSWGTGFKGRWDRFFTTVGGEGKLVSYRYHFLITILGWFAFSFFWKRRKKA